MTSPFLKNAVINDIGAESLTLLRDARDETGAQPMEIDKQPQLVPSGPYLVQIYVRNVYTARNCLFLQAPG